AKEIRVYRQLESGEADRIDDSIECTVASGPGDQVAEVRSQSSAVSRRRGRTRMKKKILGLALGALLFAFSLPAQAQQPTKMPRIGYLSGNTASSEAARTE